MIARFGGYAAIAFAALMAVELPVEVAAYFSLWIGALGALVGDSIGGRNA